MDGVLSTSDAEILATNALDIYLQLVPWFIVCYYRPVCGHLNNREHCDKGDYVAQRKNFFRCFTYCEPRST